MEYFQMLAALQDIKFPQSFKPEGTDLDEDPELCTLNDGNPNAMGTVSYHEAVEREKKARSLNGRIKHHKKVLEKAREHFRIVAGQIEAKTLSIEQEEDPDRKKLLILEIPALLLIEDIKKALDNVERSSNNFKEALRAKGTSAHEIEPAVDII